MFQLNSTYICLEKWTAFHHGLGCIMRKLSALQQYITQTLRKQNKR